jgi:DNA-binding NarL/FixJ family response regulator
LETAKQRVVGKAMEVLMAPVNSRTIKVFVRHHDPLTQAGLTSSIEDDPEAEVVQAPLHYSIDEFGFAKPGRVDVLVADYASAMAFANAKRRYVSQGGTKILIVTGSGKEVQIRTAMEAGVLGYLLAGCTLDELRLAIQTVHAGRCFVSQLVGQRMAENLMVGQLTSREGEVLKHLAVGLCNKGIARELNVSLGTVKSHMRSIFDKLHVDSRTHALVVATQRGILGGGEDEESAGSVPATPQSVVHYADAMRLMMGGTVSPMRDEVAN